MECWSNGWGTVLLIVTQMNYDNPSNQNYDFNNNTLSAAKSFIQFDYDLDLTSISLTDTI